MTPPRAFPDEVSLLAALRDGDEDAFREVLRLHHAGMVRMARSFVHSQAVAEEVAQEVWASVVQGIDRFEGRSSLKTWLYRILVKRAISRAEKEGRSVPFSAIGADDGEDVVDPSRFSATGHWSSPDAAPKRWDDDTPERLALSAESRRIIESTIESLPPNQRAVITMRDLQGWDSKDVCNILEVSETNQRVLLHRARAKVRAALETYLEGDPTS